MGTVLQTLQMVGIIAMLPMVEGLRRDTEVAAGKPGIMTMGVIVIEPFQSLPGLLRQPHRYARQASGTRYYAAIDIHNAAIIPTSHLLSRCPPSI
jgi:hypothetical protein